MSHSRLTATQSDLARRFEGRSILVIGDLMMDEYIWGRASRISPEAPVMVLDGCRRSLNSGCKRVGFSALTHHSLRHFFASVCIESGVDIQTVSRWLGHSDGGALAMRVYGHLRREHSAAMAQRVTFGTATPLPQPEAVKLLPAGIAAP